MGLLVLEEASVLMNLTNDRLRDRGEIIGSFQPCLSSKVLCPC